MIPKRWANACSAPTAASAPAAGAPYSCIWIQPCGISIALAYTQATGTGTPRHAYRWLHRLDAQISSYRNLFHQPQLAEPASMVQPRPLRRSLLASTFSALLVHFGQPLCQAYQAQLQRPFF